MNHLNLRVLSLSLSNTYFESADSTEEEELALKGNKFSLRLLAELWKLSPDSELNNK